MLPITPLKILYRGTALLLNRAVLLTTRIGLILVVERDGCTHTSPLDTFKFIHISSEK